MKITVPETNVKKAGIQQVNIGETKIGPVRIVKLVLGNVHVQTATGHAQLINTTLALKLGFKLVWRVGVVIEMPGPIPDVNFSDSGTLDLGSLEMSIGFGSISLPGLANLSFDLQSLPVTDMQVLVGPIQNLNLGAVLAEQIKAKDLVAPAGGFQVVGLGLTGIEALGLGVPTAAVETVSIGRVKGSALGNITIPNLSLPHASIPALDVGDLDATTNPVVSALTADAGVIKVTLKVTTTARLTMDELRLDNITASASMGPITLTGVDLPFEALNLTLSKLGIDTIAIPNLEVG